MRLLHWLPLAVLVAAAPARAAGPAWRSWDSGLPAAAASHRPVLVDVYTDWCGWCHRMDATVYSRPDVRSYLDSKFVVVRLNAESNETVHYGGQTMSARALASAFNVSGYPTTIFLDSGGQHLANVPGYLEPEKFLQLVHYIGDGHMDRGTSWDDYLKRSNAH